jgi:hypothetical protein
MGKGWVSLAWFALAALTYTERLELEQAELHQTSVAGTPFCFVQSIPAVGAFYGQNL